LAKKLKDTAKETSKWPQNLLSSARAKCQKLKVGRKHLTADQVAALMKAAKANRNGARDALMIALAYRHALRACEVVSLRRTDVDLKGGTIKIRRAKGSLGGNQPP
jgi:integrase